MKNEFIGFYNPTKEETDAAWDKGYFVFDANVLLNLYRYTDPTRKDFLLALHKLKSKLFMPYQVGFEFHSNRHGVIESLKESHDTLLKEIKKIFKDTISNQLSRFKRHPSIELTTIQKFQEDFLEKLEKELENQKNNHPDFSTEDPVLKEITAIFEGKVGRAFSQKKLIEIYSEGEERYKQEIPPGYKDLETKKNKGKRHIYGDLIIWKEIIEFIKNKPKPVILVTDDRKEDWWRIENGKTIGPRAELIKEFFDATEVRILIYNADSFLNFANERKLVTRIKETSIEEIKENREKEEELIQYQDKYKSLPPDSYFSGFSPPIYWKANSENFETIIPSERFGFILPQTKNEILSNWILPNSDQPVRITVDEKDKPEFLKRFYVSPTVERNTEKIEKEEVINVSEKKKKASSKNKTQKTGNKNKNIKSS